jgi:hypothetical protein
MLDPTVMNPDHARAAVCSERRVVALNSAATSPNNSTLDDLY